MPGAFPSFLLFLCLLFLAFLGVRLLFIAATFGQAKQPRKEPLYLEQGLAAFGAELLGRLAPGDEIAVGIVGTAEKLPVALGFFRHNRTAAFRADTARFLHNPLGVLAFRISRACLLYTSDAADDS